MSKEGIGRYTVGYLRVKVLDDAVELSKKALFLISKDGLLVVITKFSSNRFEVKLLQDDLADIVIDREALMDGALEVKIDTNLTARDKKTEKKVQNYFLTQDKKKEIVEKARKVLDKAETDLKKYEEQTKNIFYDILADYNEGLTDTYVKGLIEDIDCEGLEVKVRGDNKISILLSYEVKVSDVERLVLSKDKLSEFDLMNTKLFSGIEDKSTRYGLIPHAVDWFGFDLEGIRKGLVEYSDMVDVIQTVEPITAIESGDFRQNYLIRVEADATFKRISSDMIKGMVLFLSLIRKTQVEKRTALFK